jgi:hypothetical protein
MLEKQNVERLDLDDFTWQYLATALWTSIDNDTDEPLDSAYYGIENIAADSVQKAIEDCEAFQSENAVWLAACGARDSQNGHDFWLTRNRQGSGFWVRGYGDVGDHLTEAAEAYSEVDIYVGDDLAIYMA